MINVTKTFLPPLKEYEKYLQEIWKSSWVTNDAQFVKKIELELKKYLGAKHLFLVSNGTIGLQIAIKALKIKGEIITTPFSYVATTSSVVWEGCKPVFVDIDPDTLCIDPAKIENSITNKTQAILPVHVFGNPCDVESIGKIAKVHKLKLIYDSAHAFATKYKGNSILDYGDINVLSFHATKVFHTIEGGAVVTRNDHLAKKLWCHRNFGHMGLSFPEKFLDLGINAKNSELHAAMGLCVLPKIKKIIAKRKILFEKYDELFSKTYLKRPETISGTESNYGYCPVIFKSESQLLKVVKYLKKYDIFPRRYFYPSLNKLNYVTYYPCPISEDISRRILCLPLYYGLRIKDVKIISKLILEII